MSVETSMNSGERDYLPIRDYAVIGDCHGAALVSRMGSIDWCCLDRFDADPLFCRILDSEQGGCFSLSPTGDATSTRGYVRNTNILETTFTTSTGKVTLTDFMPVGRKAKAGVHNYVDLEAPRQLVRIITGVAGRVSLEAVYRPSMEFAKRSVRLEYLPGMVKSDHGAALYVEPAFDFEIAGDTARCRFEISEGQTTHFLISQQAEPDFSPLASVPRLHSITTAFWQEWMSYCRYEGAYEDAVRRSALTLKLLTYAPTGAFVAAPTTSLPEEIGGGRNWDYRYCWHRDACFAFFALAALGYSGEAKRYGDFLNLCCRATRPQVQVLSNIDGEADVTERQLNYLDGYRESRPVRVGNEAAKQHQIDIYGEILDWALLYRTLGGRIPKDARELLEGLTDHVVEHWCEPDSGLWEMRGEPRHNVHGKVMAWVALDRAINLFGDRATWMRIRGCIFDEIYERGMDVKKRCFLQSYDGAGTDAALLLLPMLGFPMERSILENTVDMVESTLRQGDFVHRYTGDDGLTGNEGAFLICNFWLVDARLALGRYGEAQDLFEATLERANDVGLYSEEIDPNTGEFLGNFPQAFTHLALIGSAFNLQLFQKGGQEALAGHYADRAKTVIGATFGWRALWAAFKVTGRFGPIWSSRRSVMPSRQRMSREWGQV